MTVHSEAADLSPARAATPALARWRGIVYLLLLLLAIALVRFAENRSILPPTSSAGVAGPH